MKYTSTRDASVRVSASQAITQGISAEGGLFVPEQIPQMNAQMLAAWAELSYIERAKTVLALYLDDFTPQELERCVSAAYAHGKFSDSRVAPLVPLADGTSVLELWKGPTCAFKDMALQLLPQLLTVSAAKAAPGKEIIILVATSGDTGKAALEGFRDVSGTKILVFYPNEGVSPMQRLQMVTQEGGNVGVYAVQGNFDDAQTGVKAIFTNPALGEMLAKENYMFSSANSINWGRLVPQIVYYISSYCDMLKAGRIQNGDTVNYVVPTGNFGNILAAYYAREMGLPVHRLICASNANNVLTEFIQSGVYNRKRDFYTTISPSMDILISSNLERLLYHMGGCNAPQVSAWMRELAEQGSYRVTEELHKGLQALFAGGFCDDVQTKQTIAELFKTQQYLADPHTAVAFRVYAQYQENTGDTTPAVIVSTANPYKFGSSVLQALSPEAPPITDEFEQIAVLEKQTGTSCPAQLKTLRGKPVRFEELCTRGSMEQAVLQLLQ